MLKSAEESLKLKLEMLAHLRAGQRDGRRCQADDDFGGWVKMTALSVLAVSGPNFNFGMMLGTFHSFQRRFPIVYRVPCRGYSHSKLPLSCKVF